MNVNCDPQAHVQSGERGVLCNHSDRWLAQHAKSREDFWYGEVDYVGACNPQRDVDCDHWDDAHDNCPFVANTDQADSNDDGIGDVCQLCPCDPGNDSDGDLVCGPTCAQGTPGCPQRCAGVNTFAVQIDNCPSVRNSEQANCNELSEQAQGVEVLGDACDPVPCPQADTGSQTTTTTCTPIQGGAAFSCTGYAVRDTALIAPIGAHVRTPPGSTAMQVRVSNVPTTARFCQARSILQTPPGQQPFLCSAGSVINDGQLLETGDFRTPGTPWHGIRTTVDRIETVAANDAFAITYGSGFQATDQWSFHTDLATWLANPADPIIPLPKDNPACIGIAHLGTTTSTCLDGTFWFHGYTDVGSDAADALVESTNVGVHAPQLANHYVGVRPDDNVIGYCPTVNQSIQIGADAVKNGRGSGPQPIVLWPAPFAAHRAFDVRSRPETELLVATTSFGIAVLQDDGRVVATHDLGSSGSVDCGGSSVDASLVAYAGQRVWTNAVEPDTRVGRHAETAAFAVASDGTAVTDRAVLDGAVLRSCTSQCDLCNDLVTSSGTIQPSSRSDFVSTYSRAANAVFIAGGKDGTGKALHDVWLYDVDARAWGEILPTGIDLGRILDLTFSFRDAKVWVVDRVRRNALIDDVRILRFDRSGGNAEVVRSWPTLHAFDRGLVFSLDRDGAPLLTIASRLRYSVVRFGSTPDGSVHPQLVDIGLGQLAFRPVVSRESYAFALQLADGSLRIRRKSTLFSDDDAHENERDHRAVDDCFR